MARRRDIIVAEIFFSDSSESKVRPCIVLSNENYGQGGYFLAALITTSQDGHCLPINEKDADCPLAKGSGARLDGIAKVPNSQARNRLGRVTVEFYDTVVGRMFALVKREPFSGIHA